MALRLRKRPQHAAVQGAQLGHGVAPDIAHPEVSPIKGQELRTTSRGEDPHNAAVASTELGHGAAEGYRPPKY